MCKRKSSVCAQRSCLYWGTTCFVASFVYLVCEEFYMNCQISRGDAVRLSVRKQISCISDIGAMHAHAHSHAPEDSQTYVRMHAHTLTDTHTRDHTSSSFQYLPQQSVHRGVRRRKDGDRLTHCALSRSCNLRTSPVFVSVCVRAFFAVWSPQEEARR